MMRAGRLLALLGALLVVGGADLLGAQLAHAQSPTLARSVEIADRWYHGQPCTGKLDVKVVESFPDGRMGEARGLDWRWNGTGYELYARTCEIAVKAGLSPSVECFVVWHEAGHLALRTVDHHGDLDYTAKGPPDCGYLRAAEPEATEVEKPAPQPITARQRAYREHKHAYYHSEAAREAFSDERRLELAAKWHRLAEAT